MDIVTEVNALRAKGKSVKQACRKLGIKEYSYYNRTRAGQSVEPPKPPTKLELAAVWKGEIVYVMNRKTAVQLIKDLGI
jgi:hypothetical protein